MKRLEFHISYVCPNNCIFCSESANLKKGIFNFVAVERVREKLAEFSARGFNHLTFTGGEPTLHPDFIEILKLAKGFGFKTYVSSNGGLLSRERFCEQTLAYISEICFSLHGHNAKLHNFHTRNNQSFSKLIRALRNIEEAPYDIYGFINIIVTRYNFNFLNEIMEFISHYNKIRQILISNLAPEGNGLVNFEELTVPLIELQKKIGVIVRKAQDRSLIVRFFGIPLCILNGYKNFSNDAYWSSRATVEKWQSNKRVFLKETLSYKPNRGRIKTEKCKNCMGKENCGGIFKRYYHEFGDNELKPLLNAK